MPEFPDVRFELGFRNTIDKATQEKIINEIYRISFPQNPRVWIGIKWLCTYIAIRPGEMRRIQEKHIDLTNGILIVPHPKEKRPKLVPMLDDDVELVRSLPAGGPEDYFFRHPSGKGFGPNYFYIWWKRACRNLGIDGVDLYGGTRHSSAIALKKYRAPEEIKRATMHSTNKAFERYFWIETGDLREIYRDTVGRMRGMRVEE